MTTACASADVIKDQIKHEAADISVLLEPDI